MRLSTDRETTPTQPGAVRRKRRSLGCRLRTEKLEHRYFLFAASAVEAPSLLAEDIGLASPIEVAVSSPTADPTAADSKVDLALQKIQESLDFGGHFADTRAWQALGSDSSTGLIAEGEFAGDSSTSTPSITPAIPPSAGQSLSSGQTQSVVASPELSRFDWLLGSVSTGLRAEGEANWGGTNFGQAQAISEPLAAATNSLSQLTSGSLPWTGQAVDSAIQLLSVQQRADAASISDLNLQLPPSESQSGLAGWLFRDSDLEWDSGLNSPSVTRVARSQPDLDSDLSGTELSSFEHLGWAVKLDNTHGPMTALSSTNPSGSRSTAQVKPMGLAERFVSRLWGDASRRAATYHAGNSAASVSGSTQSCDAGQIDLSDQPTSLSPSIGNGRQGRGVGDAFAFGASSVPSMYREFDLAGVDSARLVTQVPSQVFGSAGPVSAQPESSEGAAAELTDLSAETLGAEESVLSSDNAWLPLGFLTLGGIMLTSRRNHSRLAKPGDQAELADPSR